MVFVMALLMFVLDIANSNMLFHFQKTFRPELVNMYL